MTKDAQTIVTLLDQQYEHVLADAKCLVASYVDASMKLYRKTGVKSVVAAVSIKQASPNAYSIYWCKLVPLQGQKNKFAPLTIAKGNGRHKYPASSFEFVKSPYRCLVLQVEERLAEIRGIASENRQLRRTLVAYEKKLSRYQALDHGDLYSEE
ncbi:conjugative transfer protein MobI(A/C) [Pseudomonas sp. EL_65y_Pfl1_R32]|uniref:conjugative transfer protein MobI(A/C) n=1 Tax=Pseudomonas sp. EL_65y_Pfl1_R32 TaxID=3088696 RepID=UPI0030D7E4EE